MTFRCRLRDFLSTIKSPRRSRSHRRAIRRPAANPPIVSRPGQIDIRAGIGGNHVYRMMLAVAAAAQRLAIEHHHRLVQLAHHPADSGAKALLETPRIQQSQHTPERVMRGYAVRQADEFTQRCRFCLPPLRNRAYPLGTRELRTDRHRQHLVRSYCLRLLLRGSGTSLRHDTRAMRFSISIPQKIEGKRQAGQCLQALTCEAALENTHPNAIALSRNARQPAARWKSHIIKR
jgi:hypothetical protein